MIPGGLSKEQEEAYLCKFSSLYFLWALIIGQSAPEPLHGSSKTIVKPHFFPSSSDSTASQNINAILSRLRSISITRNIIFFVTLSCRHAHRITSLLQYSWRSRRAPGSFDLVTWASQPTRTIGAPKMQNLILSPFTPMFCHHQMWLESFVYLCLMRLFLFTVYLRATSYLNQHHWFWPHFSHPKQNTPKDSSFLRLQNGFNWQIGKLK